MSRQTSPTNVLKIIYCNFRIIRHDSYTINTFTIQFLQQQQLLKINMQNLLVVITVYTQLIPEKQQIKILILDNLLLKSQFDVSRSFAPSPIRYLYW